MVERGDESQMVERSRAQFPREKVNAVVDALGLSEPEVAGEDLRQRVAVSSFKRGLKITRVGRSYIAEIQFTSLDPQKSARIANEWARGHTTTAARRYQRSIVLP